MRQQLTHGGSASLPADTGGGRGGDLLHPRAQLVPQRFELGADGSALVDGDPLTIADGSTVDFGEGASLTRSSNIYTLTWPGTGARPSVRMQGNAVSVSVPPTDDLTGLLGDNDGDPSNDLMTSWGEQLSSNSSPAVLHGTYADSWRISDDVSLFSYGDGQTTETFTDRSFPSQILTIDQLDDAALEEGATVCTGAGVVDGRQFDDCVLDWAVTKNYDFVQSAAQQVTPLTEGGAHGVDNTGAIDEDFENSIPANFASPRYGVGAGSGTFAGLFGRDGRYVFYVPDLPAHDNVTLSLNLIAFGDLDPFDGAATTVTVNGATAWSANLGVQAPSRTGTTASGKPYAVFPVTVTVPHIDAQLNVGVQSAIPLASDRAIGVDDVRAQLDLVAPQHFDVAVPFEASDGAPSAGAGNIETAASEDIYDFTLANAADLQIDVSACSTLGSVSYRLVNATTGALVRSSWSCGSELVTNVPAGAYRLSATNRGRSGTYRLAVSLRADPQTFATTLPATVTNGVPSPGAGNLETTSSEDAYTFTTTAKGAVQLDVSECATGINGIVRYALTDTSDQRQVSNGQLSCNDGGAGVQVRDLAPGSYRLAITDNGGKGTYKLGIDSVAPAVDAVTLPLETDGALVSPASENLYTFTTTAKGNLQIDLSSCEGNLSGWVWYSVTNAATGETVGQGRSCWSQLLHDVPAGTYRLSISNGGHTGTYHLGVGMQPDPESTAVTLPLAQDTNLETTSSEDDYTFTTAAKGALQLDVSQCATTLGGSVRYELTDRADGHKVGDGWLSCSDGGAGVQLRAIPAGDYKLAITDFSRRGGYHLHVESVLAQQIASTLPLDTSGILASPASEQVYTFSTAAAGNLQIDLSSCSSSLGWVLYTLSDADTGATKSESKVCWSQTVKDLPAGNYRLSISNGGRTGTYDIGLGLQPDPQAFAVTLPISISDGDPATGAGNLETTSSEDDYRFTTDQPGALQLDVSQCATKLKGSVKYVLTDRSDGHKVGDGLLSCNDGGAGVQLRAIPAGSYQVAITDYSFKGTYKLHLDAVAPQTSAVTLPIDTTGNLETKASEDIYTFTTTTTANLQVNLSNCQSSLGGSVLYSLVDAHTGVNKAQGRSCWSQSVSQLPPGDYRMSITNGARTGTYHIAMATQ